MFSRKIICVISLIITVFGIVIISPVSVYEPTSLAEDVILTFKYNWIAYSMMLLGLLGLLVSFFMLRK